MSAEEINHIAHKKANYPVSQELSKYLERHSRAVLLPIHYTDLLRWNGLMPQVDAQGKETLWQTVLLHPSEIEEMQEKLVALYQLVVADGRKNEHLKVASIDFCGYGNSQPFRIKILNRINDNHDYYYIKKADASRVYGLELEHLLSPNKINYVVDGDTLVEEHIIGVPGDAFILDPERYGGHLNPVRLSKEFVKFNETELRTSAWAICGRTTSWWTSSRISTRCSIDCAASISTNSAMRVATVSTCHSSTRRIWPYVKFAEQYISTDNVEQYSNEERALLAPEVSGRPRIRSRSCLR